MKILFQMALTAGFALYAGAAIAQAQDANALMTANKCTNCHAVDQRKIGPSFTDTANKYRANADADTTIVAELRDGKGHPKVAAPEADIKTMVDYILALH